MDINYLIQLLKNRLSALALSKDQAFQAGDLDRINTLDSETSDVINTLAKLNLLAGISQTAAATPFTEAQVVKNGIEASFNYANLLTNPSGVLEPYDISSYATDPQYQQKIQTILSSIPLLTTAGSIDAYIQSMASGSPVSGDMVYSASNTYNVDIPLLVAIMQNDSNFGTVGVGARTLNPGNVGNTGTAEHTYASWQDGVSAVAQWLDNHRVVNIPAVVAPVLIKKVVPDTATTTTPVIPNTSTSSSTSTSTAPSIQTSTSTSATPDTSTTTTPVTPNTSTSSSTSTSTAPSIQTSTSTSATPDTSTTTTPVIPDTSTTTSTSTPPTIDTSS